MLELFDLVIIMGEKHRKRQACSLFRITKSLQSLLDMAGGLRL